MDYDETLLKLVADDNQSCNKRVMAEFKGIKFNCRLA
jgi:hypothetical protein